MRPTVRAWLRLLHLALAPPEPNLGAGPALSTIRLLGAELKTGHPTTLAQPGPASRELLASRRAVRLGALSRETLTLLFLTLLARPPSFSSAALVTHPHHQQLRLIASTRHCTHEAAISTSFAAPITSRPPTTRPSACTDSFNLALPPALVLIRSSPAAALPCLPLGQLPFPYLIRPRGSALRHRVAP